MATQSQSISLLPVTQADIPILASMAASSFLTDRHTQMKELGQTPYNMEAVVGESIARYINSDTAVLIKAVDAVSGKIAGFSGWGFRGLQEEEIPILEGAPEKVEISGGTTWRDQRSEKRTTEEEAAVESDPIKRLVALTDADMKSWMQKLMPEGTRCMFVASFHVDPKYQRRGIGSALLKWGTDVADEREIFIWVHSSEAGVKAYEKAGFEPIGILDINLDEYAPRPPPEEVGGEIWGHYFLTYLKYLPKKRV